MIVKKILNIDGKLQGIFFDEIISIEDIHKAQEVFNRLILDIETSYYLEINEIDD